MRGLRLKRESDWIMDNTDDELNENCTGKTIFIVDRNHLLDHGTDQGRQRIEALNPIRVFWASAFD